MKPIADILVPLDGSPTALKSLPVASWLASRLNAHLHILRAGTSLPGASILAQLGIEKKYASIVDVHQAPAPAVEAILKAVEQYHIDMVIMTAQGESAQPESPESTQLVGHVTREVIERISAPVLVLPRTYEEVLPWRSALVPMSGEPATDESLALALQLAHSLELSVNVAHITGAPPKEGETITGWYVDEIHHEFANMLNQLVARSCPMCSSAERSRVQAFHIKQGDIGDELLDMAERKSISLLVVGWHGEFMVGHAQVLKRLMREIRRPLLLVKPHPRGRFRLKVGEAFE